MLLSQIRLGDGVAVAARNGSEAAVVQGAASATPGKSIIVRPDPFLANTWRVAA